MSTSPREQLMPWVMGLVRALVGWLLVRVDVVQLTGSGALRELSRPLLASFTAAALAAGVLLFAWRRTCYAGAVLLALGLCVAQWLWRQAGLNPGAPLAVALAAVAVLAAREWLTARLARRGR